MGNFADALYRASLAICSETPSTSNKILPGLTLHAKIGETRKTIARLKTILKGKINA